LVPIDTMADVPKVDRIIMNAPEVADFLRVSESTIRKLVKEKRIPYFKLEGRYLFYRGTIETWVSDLTIEPEKGSIEGEASHKAEEIWNQRKGK